MACHSCSAIDRATKGKERGRRKEGRGRRLMDGAGDAVKGERGRVGVALKAERMAHAGQAEQSGLPSWAAGVCSARVGERGKKGEARGMGR